MDIHHVACVEIFHLDPVFKPGQDVPEVINRIFGGKEWRRQVEISVQDKNVQVWILGHDVR